MRAFLSLLVLIATPARASFLSGEALDKAADVLALFVIIIVPIVAVVVFWLVHILPEKFAHQRHHPQRDAIQVLCLLSLVFGGLLWPLAWLWAFTKPIGHRMAYGTDKHEDFYDGLAEKHGSGTLSAEELHILAVDLAAMEKAGALSPQLKALKARIDATETGKQA